MFKELLTEFLAGFAIMAFSAIVGYLAFVTRERIRGRTEVYLVILFFIGLYFMGSSAWKGIGLLFSPAIATSPIQTSTIQANPTANTSLCLDWKDVTGAMIGKEICARGIVDSITNFSDGGTSIQFFIRPQVYYSFTDIDTIYPYLKEGDCVQTTGVLQRIEAAKRSWLFIVITNGLLPCE